jgi:hypothetical protein
MSVKPAAWCALRACQLQQTGFGGSARFVVTAGSRSAGPVREPRAAYAFPPMLSHWINRSDAGDALQPTATLF